jgi:hypothetical protein
MTACAVTTIALESGSVEHALDALSAALPKLAQLGPEVVDRLIGLINSGAKLVVFEDDLGSAGARELIMRAKPSDGLLGLVAAVSARDVDLAVIEQALSHVDLSFVGGSDTPTLTESPVVRKDAGGEVQDNDGEGA